MRAEEIVAAYRKDGFAHVPNVVEKNTLDALRARADEIMHGRVAHEGLFFQLDTTTGNYWDIEWRRDARRREAATSTGKRVDAVDSQSGNGWQGPSDNYRKIEKLERDPIFRAWIENAFFESIVRSVIEGDVTMYRALLMTKAARGGTVLPWHQDAGKFWGLDRDPPIQIWTALDDAPVEAGCLEVLPGSHARGLVTPLGGLVPEDRARDFDAEKNLVQVPARAGDVVVLHNLVWHRSGVNRTDHTRRAFSVCYMSAATKCTRTKKTPRTFLKVF